MADPSTLTQNEASIAETSKTIPKIVKIIAALVALGALLFLGRQLGSYVPQFAAWVESLGPLGPAVFIAGYSIATVAFIPGSILTLAAGAIFGLAKGTLFVFIGAAIGSALAFLVARYVARSSIERRIEESSRFAAIDSAVAKEGLKIVFLLRLSPIFPYNLLNYALGLTRVSFRDYVIASIGMLPGTFLYVYYGKAIGSLAAVAGGAEVDKGVGYWVVLTLGLLATVVVTTIVTKIARKALTQEVHDGRA
jgi:uncharacterized membrane protein YdjX (TVP38/TMEM64 family)